MVIALIDVLRLLLRLLLMLPLQRLISCVCWLSTSDPTMCAVDAERNGKSELWSIYLVRDVTVPQ